MTADADERSIQSGAPIELYDLAFATQTFRYTTWSRSFTYLGNVYTPGTLRRGPITVVNSQDIVEPPIEMAITDPVVALYFGNGVPPQKFSATITRVQQNSGEANLIATGPASFTVRGRSAVLKILPAQSNPMQLQLPVAELSRLCNHVLYDPQCTIARAANQVVTTIASIDATRRIIGVTSIGAFSGSDFKFGELLHNTSKERRVIVSQASLVMTLDVRLPTSFHVGDAITVFRGCDRTAGTCSVKFNNIVNHGGHPQLVSTGYVFANLLGTS